MEVHKFRVKAGSRVDLSKFDPSAKSGVPAAKEERMQQLAQLAERVDALQDLLYAQGLHKVLVVLQGMDTAGKDGTIRHVFGEVDPLGVRAISFRAPVGEELEHDFLWRVHRQVPRRGEIAIFNRSHYEDVLVVRVRALQPEKVWRQRYRQIVDFERLLAESGTTILKFFLHISNEEQRQRFQARLDDPNKRWKFRSGDLEDRALWNDYQAAYAEAISRTSTSAAPWYVIPADRKWFRDLAVASVLVQALENLKMRVPAGEPGLERLRIP